MKRTNHRLCLAVLAAMALLLSSVLACNFGSTPFRRVSSYAEIQRQFNGESGILYPDISCFNPDESAMEYKLEHVNANHSTPTIGYVATGEGRLNGNKMSFALSCCRGILNCANPLDYLEYNGVKIATSSYDLEKAYSDSFSVHINGYEYTVDATFDQGKLLPSDEVAKLRSDVRDALYSFICRIIDQAQAKA